MVDFKEVLLVSMQRYEHFMTLRKKYSVIYFLSVRQKFICSLLKVKIVISHRFDEAAQREDLASVERFFKIFPLINMHEEGLRKFTKFLSGKVKGCFVLWKVKYTNFVFLSSYH